jgi:hypothetical protein
VSWTTSGNKRERSWVGRGIPGQTRDDSIIPFFFYG